MKAILKQLDIQPEKTALIGDQLFTDILVANRCGILAVLVRPLDLKREWWATKLLTAAREAV